MYTKGNYADKHWDNVGTQVFPVSFHRCHVRIHNSPPTSLPFSLAHLCLSRFQSYLCACFRQCMSFVCALSCTVSQYTHSGCWAPWQALPGDTSYENRKSKGQVRTSLHVCAVVYTKHTSAHVPSCTVLIAWYSRDASLSACVLCGV